MRGALEPPLSAADQRLADAMRADLHAALGSILDVSKDAARHRRANEITDGRFAAALATLTDGIDEGALTMATIDDGGPAFPQAAFDEDGLLPNAGGMKLRDYFAAHAPISNGLIVAAGDVAATGVERVGDGTARQLATWAYRYADAMLKERAK